MIKAASNIVQQTDSIPITVTKGNTASAGNGNNHLNSHLIKRLWKKKQLNLVSADRCGSYWYK